MLFTGIFLAGSMIMLLVLVMTTPKIARNYWVSLWVGLSPLFFSSIILFPHFPLMAVIALASTVSILLAVWGYYGCFYPLIGLDSRLHKAHYARRRELAE